MATKPQDVVLDESEEKMSSLLHSALPEEAMKDMPIQLKGMVKGIIDGFAVTLSGMIGEGAAKAFHGIGKAAGVTDEKRLHNLHKMGNRVGRSAVTLATDIAPAVGIVKGFLKENKSIKQNFALALRAEGASGGLFSSGTQLEVVRHQQQKHSRVTKYKTQGFLFDLMVQSVPTLAFNEVDRLAGDVERYYVNEVLKKYGNDAVDELDGSQKTLLSKVKAEKKANPELFQRRMEDAKQTIEWMEKRPGIFPDTKGVGGNSFIHSIAPLLPGFAANTTTENGFGQFGTLKFFAQLQTLFKPVLSWLMGTRLENSFGPKATALEKTQDAGKMITSLENYMAENSSPNVTIDNKTMPLEEYIYKIFTQHRTDMGRKALSGVHAENLREACADIADAMLDPHRKLHPQALVHLVDGVGKSGVIKAQKGKVTSVLQGEALHKVMYELIDTKKLSAREGLKKGEDAFTHEKYGKEEFLASWNNLTPEEQFVWSSLFSDEVLLKAGLPKEEVKNNRAKGNEYVAEVLEEVFREISRNYSQQDLIDAGIDKSTAAKVNKVIEAIRRTPSYLVDHREEVTKLVAEAGVKLENDRPGFLSKILDRAEAKHEGREPEPESRKGNRARDDDDDRPRSTQENIERIKREKPLRDAQRKGGKRDYQPLEGRY